MRVVALFYGRERKEFVSIWFVFSVLFGSLPTCYVFLFLFFKFELKKSVLIPIISEKSSIGIACFQV